MSISFDIPTDVPGLTIDASYNMRNHTFSAGVEEGVSILGLHADVWIGGDNMKYVNGHIVGALPSPRPLPLISASIAILQPSFPLHKNTIPTRPPIAPPDPLHLYKLTIFLPAGSIDVDASAGIGPFSHTWTLWDHSFSVSI